MLYFPSAPEKRSKFTIQLVVLQQLCDRNEQPSSWSQSRHTTSMLNLQYTCPRTKKSVAWCIFAIGDISSRNPGPSLLQTRGYIWSSGKAETYMRGRFGSERHVQAEWEEKTRNKYGRHHPHPHLKCKLRGLLSAIRDIHFFCLGSFSLFFTLKVPRERRGMDLPTK